MIDSQRQQYGLGSFVKKIARGAKKVFKSPLGKAALIGGGLWGLNKYGIGSGGIGKNWWSKGLGWGKGALLGKGAVGGPPNVARAATKGLWGKLGDFGYGKAALLGGGALATALPFMGGGDEEEEVIDDWSVTPSSIANIRNMARKRDPSLAFMPAANYVQSGYYLANGGIAGLANGGNPAEAQVEQMLRMEYQKYRNQGGTLSYPEFKMQVMQQAQGSRAQGQPQMAQPQMAAEGGLMSLGGMEKDYRNEGGFVALGKKEKADDVPARLSKNEFVFTADAVRNAGGGDVNQGAEVMDNMMKHLESGGQISEDSQGAQGMYDNMKQLETRIA